MICRDCPRNCAVDRAERTGFCGCGRNAVVAKTVDPFKLEEPCLGDTSAVFFAGCSLKCSYCQNYKISRRPSGKEYTDEELAELFDSLVPNNAVDLVTPTHFLSAIENAARKTKTRRRFIYNTSGYETIDGVRRAAEFCQVFLADYKYADSAAAARFSAAPDYPETALTALKEMRRLAPDCWKETASGKILERGVIVRHLVLPGCVQNSVRALDAIAAELGTDAGLSLMSQFTPNGVGNPTARLKPIEYRIVAEHALKLGFTEGYFQSLDSADPDYTPDF